LFVFQVCFSQSREEKNARCTKTNNLSEIQRLSHFPFSETSTVKLVSFKNKNIGIVGDELQEHIDSIKLKEDKFNPLLYNEVATLDSLKINKLTDIIYNYTYKKKPYSIRAATCYMPRNAIFFIDNNNNIIAYIEICFGCDAYRASAKEINIGEYCNEKYEMIKSIFKDCKIEYGITMLE